ncbi:interleukin-17 receptor E-like protein isoform X2 [Erythrolamprus reginae]|uniref:interleukin-17 receptor E-like protein isoform X2 n=1 Tax=Erythrolamprus reginae TaxID=121349 RepID=UPI00396D028C
MKFMWQLFAIFYGTYGYQPIPRIKECGVTCSQGFHCKHQFSMEAMNSFCHLPPDSLTPVNLKNMKLGTTMKCEDHRRCSLYLSVKATLQLNENTSGVLICYFLMFTQKTKCVKVKISRGQSAYPEGNKVKIQFNCFEVSVGQHLYLTMTTIPYYCGVKQTQEYYVEDCRNSDVGENIPDCFVSKLAYKVDRTRKTISVNISDVQNIDCYVRLCHQRFVCEDVAPVTLIQGKDMMKSASLQYAQLLPCLCIEVWPAILDARRMQLCPFKNDTKSLWDNIVYQPATQTLTWEAACPVHVTVSLCQLMKINDQCVDLEGTVNIAAEKVKYSRVDTHPSLCIKFVTENNVWVKCPFNHGKFQAWKMQLAEVGPHIEVSFASPFEAEFSVLVCNRTNLHSCNSTRSPKTLSLGGLNLSSVNISGKPCSSNICIKGWRTDVDYSVSLYVCDLPCDNSRKIHEEKSVLHMITHR